ncbi:MAG: hypothetical protein U9N55_04940 [candidate division Zixibacteria bacterium]|nr:hypothetical protein [candidate division Zixibacteria bacterium]
MELFLVANQDSVAASGLKNLLSESDLLDPLWPFEFIAYIEDGYSNVWIRFEDKDLSHYELSIEWYSLNNAEEVFSSYHLELIKRHSESCNSWNVGFSIHTTFLLLMTGM